MVKQFAFSLFQIDVLEADVLCNVIILQTVLEEVKHRSSTIYKRLKDIINDKRRKFYVFVNEHHKLVFFFCDSINVALGPFLMQFLKEATNVYL